MSLAALEALIAGVKVRYEVVERSSETGTGRQGLLAQRGRHRPQVGLGGVALAYRRYSMDCVAENKARKARRGMWRGTFVKPACGANHHRRAPRHPHPRLRPGRDGCRRERDCAIVCTSRSGRDIGTCGIRLFGQMARTTSRSDWVSGALGPSRRGRSGALTPTIGRYGVGTSWVFPKLVPLSYGPPRGQHGHGLAQVSRAKSRPSSRRPVARPTTPRW
jgi:hypothetical protein